MPEQISSPAQDLQRAVEFTDYLRASLGTDTPADQRQPFEIGKFLTESRHLQRAMLDGVPVIDLPETRDLYLDAGRNKVVWEGVFNEVIKTTQLTNQNNNPTDLQREVRAYLGIAVALGMDQPNENDPNLQKTQQIISNLIKVYGSGLEEAPVQLTEPTHQDNKGRNRFIRKVGGAITNILLPRGKQPEQTQDPNKPIFTKGEVAKGLANLTPKELETLVRDQFATWIALDNGRARSKGPDEISRAEALQLMERFKKIPGTDNMTLADMAREVITNSPLIDKRTPLVEKIAGQIDTINTRYQNLTSDLVELINNGPGPNDNTESQAQAIIASFPQITGEEQADIHRYSPETLYEAYKYYQEHGSIKPEIEEIVLERKYFALENNLVKLLTQTYLSKGEASSEGEAYSKFRGDSQPLREYCWFIQGTQNEISAYKEGVAYLTAWLNQVKQNPDNIDAPKLSNLDTLREEAQKKSLLHRWEKYHSTPLAEKDTWERGILCDETARFLFGDNPARKKYLSEFANAAKNSMAGVFLSADELELEKFTDASAKETNMDIERDEIEDIERAHRKSTLSNETLKTLTPTELELQQALEGLIPTEQKSDDSASVTETASSPANPRILSQEEIDALLSNSGTQETPTKPDHAVGQTNHEETPAETLQAEQEIIEAIAVKLGKNPSEITAEQVQEVFEKLKQGAFPKTEPT